MRNKIIKFTAGIFILIAISIIVSEAISAAQKKDELYRDVALFSDALAIIQNDYVDEAKPKDLIYGALKGMLSSLDPHSQFMDPDTYNELKVDTEGKFGGLGIEITIKDGLLTIITPIEDTPAWRVGVKTGDRIVKINGELTRDITLIDAVKKLRGKPGTQVNITVWREKSEKLLDFTIIRDIIKIKDIKEAKILEDGVGYIRLVEFREDTPRDFERILKKLKQDGMKSLILDLRNNPGGLLDIAARISGKFVESGKLIVSTKGRKKSQDMEFISDDKNPYLDMPLVVLVNNGSASGSEIVAGCLQDYRRGIVLGINTFGKGSVQTVIPLSDGSALRLTTSKYFTPLGRSIHGEGIKPDVIVEQKQVEITAQQSEEIPQAIFDELQKEDQIKTEEPEDYTNDSQLIRAIDLLKAISIYEHYNKTL